MNGLGTTGRPPIAAPTALRGWVLRVPNRVPLAAAAGGLLVLLAFQLGTGTSLAFAELTVVFGVLTVIAVNLAGGLRSVAGVTIFLMALEMAGIGQVAKVLLREAGDSNLRLPLETLEVYAVGMAGVVGAGLVTRLLPKWRPLLRTGLDARSLTVATWVTLVLGLLAMAGSWVLGAADGSLRVGGVPGLLRQLQFCSYLAVAFASARSLTRSRGRMLFQPLTWLAILVPCLVGVLTSGRQLILQPFLVVFFTAVAYGFRFQLIHLLAILATVVLAVGVVYPLAQAARDEVRGADLLDSVSLAVDFAERRLSSREGVKELYARADDYGEQVGEEYSYFNTSRGILDRLSLIKPDDQLVYETGRKGFSGWTTLKHGVSMVVPRVLNPRKPAIGTGTFLGHKAGLLDEQDEGTQASFSAFADSYSAFGWAGALMVPLLVFALYFVVYQRLAGEWLGNPWAVTLASMLHFEVTWRSTAGVILVSLWNPIWWVLVLLLVRAAVALAVRLEARLPTAFRPGV